jgi:glycosyltransferase involved in cell wall biosynthesis
VRGRRPLNVAHVISTMTWGGAEMLLADLAGSLPGVDVTASVTYLAELDGSPAVARLRERGIEPALVPMTLLHDPRGQWRLRCHLATLRPDVVHTHLAHADLLGSVAARSLGIPSVTTLHVMEWATTGKAGARERLVALARRRLAARVVAVSEAGRRAYLERGWDEPLHVVKIHNGVVATPCPGAGAAVRAELGFAEDDLVVATLSVLREGKGHGATVDAIVRLREQFDRLRLLVVGEGPARGEIERAVGALGGAGVLTGHRDDVMRILDAVDVLVHPSRIDAFPTALLEAMAAGVPVVAAAVGGIPEIVDDATTGVLVAPPADGVALAATLAPLLADRARRAALGGHARERFAERFSADRWALSLRGLYDDVLAAKVVR